MTVFSQLKLSFSFLQILIEQTVRATIATNNLDLASFQSVQNRLFAFVRHFNIPGQTSHINRDVSKKLERCKNLLDQPFEYYIAYYPQDIKKQLPNDMEHGQIYFCQVLLLLSRPKSVKFLRCKKLTKENCNI